MVEPLSGELERGSGNIDGRSFAGAPGRGSHRTEGGDVCGAQDLGGGARCLAVGMARVMAGFGEWVKSCLCLGKEQWLFRASILNPK